MSRIAPYLLAGFVLFNWKVFNFNLLDILKQIESYLFKHLVNPVSELNVVRSEIKREGETQKLERRV